MTWIYFSLHILKNIGSLIISFVKMNQVLVSYDWMMIGFVIKLWRRRPKQMTWFPGDDFKLVVGSFFVLFVVLFIVSLLIKIKEVLL